MRIVLASGSPRRKELLGWMGLAFTVIDHQIDEEILKKKIKSAARLVTRLAKEKAVSANNNSELADSLVLGCDLVVGLDKRILGKPQNNNQAEEMLRELRGKTHIIYTGLASWQTKSRLGKTILETSTVTMKNYSDEVINRYIKEVPVLDRGGAYGIQDKIEGYGSLVEKFEGGITNILGLPLNRLEELLLNYNIKPKKDWRKICRQKTGYEY